MKAFALTAADHPAAPTDLPDPEVAADGALIRIRAASVNGFDVYQASGGLTALMPHDLPTVVGRDVQRLAERGIRATNIMGTPTPEKLATIAGQAASGTLQVPVQQTFLLADAPAAMAAFSAGTRGKVVLTIE